MAVEIVTKSIKYARYYVAKTVFEYEEDNSIKTTITYWTLETKNTSVGLAPDFDEEKWSTVETIPETAKRLKEVSTEDGETGKVAEVLSYYYEWYTEEEEVVEHVKGICVNCKYHTTENPNLMESELCKAHSYICEGQQVIQTECKEGHYCKAYVKSDYIAGKDVYDRCTEHNASGECIKYEIMEPEPTEPVEPPVITQVENTVTMESVTEGAVVFYTLNGDDPVTAGIEYTEPVEITEDVTVHAVAVKDGEYSTVSEKFCEYTE